MYSTVPSWGKIDPKNSFKGVEMQKKTISIANFELQVVSHIGSACDKKYNNSNRFQVINVLYCSIMGKNISKK